MLRGKVIITLKSLVRACTKNHLGLLASEIKGSFQLIFSLIFEDSKHLLYL